MVLTSHRARASLPPKTVLQAALQALLVALLVALLAACSSSEGEPAAVASPTGSPFGVTITGPDTAAAGDTVTATLTNTGRLPDGYRLVADPFEAVTIAEPEVRLGAGEKAEIQVQVLSVPVLVRVQSISGGQGGSAAVLSIGEAQ